MDWDVMRETARDLVAPGKGILAADQSTGTIEKRFDQIGVDSTEENRRRYRQMLFTTLRLGAHISGVILYDETIRQAADDGTPFVEVLDKAGVIAGIKVDTGAKPLRDVPRRDGDRGARQAPRSLAEYREIGARVREWRVTITINEGMPPTSRSSRTPHPTARYAALCQETDLVPIVEPEGADGRGPPHRRVPVGYRTDTAGARLATGRASRAAAGDLAEGELALVGGLPGPGGHEQIAETTGVLPSTVPAEVPGVVSVRWDVRGGRDDRLNETNSTGHPAGLSSIRTGTAGSPRSRCGAVYQPTSRPPSASFRTGRGPAAWRGPASTRRAST